MLTGLLFLAVATAGAPQAAAADPLAPVRAGKFRCVSPKAANRTCSTIVRYTVHGDGSYEAIVTGIVMRDPVILIEYRMSGRVEDGTVCGVVRASDFEAGRLLRDGAPLAPGAAANVRAQIMDALQPLAGKRRCYRDQPDGGEVLLSNVTIDGVAHPELAQRAAWLSPDEGYAVGE